MAPVDTKQKYRKLYLSKKCRMKINNATLRYLKCTLFQRVLDQAILSDAITTVYIICYQLLSYAKNTILANFVEMLLRLFCDITGCYRNLWRVSKEILENRVKSCYFTLPFANSRCPLTTA